MKNDMTQIGIYAAPCDIVPNRDRVANTDCAVKEQKLWIIEFKVKHLGNGCAVVKAYSPKEAERLLKSEGVYNGMSYMYNITRIEEIIPSPDSMLIAEQIAATDN